MIAVALLCATLLTAAPEELLGRLQSGELTARPGEWVTYRATTGSGLPVFFRVAAVQEEPLEQAVWLELDAGLTPGLEAPLLQLGLLCERAGARLTGKIRRAVAAVLHRPPLELTPPRTPERRSPSGVTAAPLPPGFRFRLGPRRRLATRAGSLLAKPWEVLYRDQVVQRMWMSEAVPLLQLARLELPMFKQVIELQASGLGAEPRLKLPPAEKGRSP